MKIVVLVLVIVALLMVWRDILRPTRRGGISRRRSKPSAVRNLADAAEWMGAIRGSRVRPYSTFEFGRLKDEHNVSAVVPAKAAERGLLPLRAVLGPGLIAFIGTTQWLGEETHDGVELVVANGQSQLDILRAARTEPVNEGLTTEDVVAHLQKLHERYGIDVLHAETDRVQFRLAALPKDMRTLAE